MPSIGKPFDHDKKGSRVAVILACPVCRADGRYVIMDSRMVLEHDPAGQPEDIETPFCVYSCTKDKCGYQEIHWYMLMRKT